MEHVLVRKVRELAAASPCNVYRKPENEDGCRYSRGVCSNGSVGCLIGQALTALGYDPGSIDDVGPLTVRGAIRELGISDLVPVEIEWLNTVQVSQDVGGTWADAVLFADRAHSNI